MTILLSITLIIILLHKIITKKAKFQGSNIAFRVQYKKSLWVLEYQTNPSGMWETYQNYTTAKHAETDLKILSNKKTV